MKRVNWKNTDWLRKPSIIAKEKNVSTSAVYYQLKKRRINANEWKKRNPKTNLKTGVKRTRNKDGFGRVAD